MTGSVPTTHFDQLYAKSDDPWHFESSAYESAKYAATIAALGGRTFAHGFELGCSIGVLSAMVAPYCQRLLAADCSQAAVSLARRKQGHLRNVTFRQMRAPQELPCESFDLIVLSEVLYFFSPKDLIRVAEFCRAWLAPGGMAVLVNYLGPTDTGRSGDAAAQGFLDHVSAWANLMRRERYPEFRIDVIERRSIPPDDVNGYLS